MKHSAPIEEKIEQEVTAVAKIPAAVAAENVVLNTIEDMQMIVEDEEELDIKNVRCQIFRQ